MKRLIIILIATSVCVAQADDFERKIKPVLQQHCIKCHGENGKVKGKVNLQELTQGKHLLAKPELIEGMLASLENLEMPPEDEPELPANVREELITNLGHLLEKSLADAEFAPTPKIEEANGTTLLDNMIFTLGAGLGDGATHQYNDLPLVVAGGGGGKLGLGSHVHVAKTTPLANLWLTHLQALGIKMDRYADSAGLVKGILA